MVSNNKTPLLINNSRCMEVSMEQTNSSLSSNFTKAPTRTPTQLSLVWVHLVELNNNSNSQVRVNNPLRSRKLKHLELVSTREQLSLCLKVKWLRLRNSSLILLVLVLKKHLNRRKQLHNNSHKHKIFR